MRCIDAFVFSSTMAASIAGALSMLASRLLEAPDAVASASLASLGTFIVYNVDRLRDLERDRSTSPNRTRFILENRRLLMAMIGVAAIGLGTTLLAADPAIVLLCAVVGSLGLMHRRLKRRALWKTIYVSAAWVAACVGVPWLASDDDRGLRTAVIRTAAFAGPTWRRPV